MSFTTNYYEVVINPKDLDAIIDMLATKQPIPAIKAFRILTDQGLKESKDAIDRVRALGPSGDTPWGVGHRHEARQQLEAEVMDSYVRNRFDGRKYLVFLRDDSERKVGPILNFSNPATFHMTNPQEAPVVDAGQRRLLMEMSMLMKEQSLRLDQMVQAIVTVCDLLRENNELLKDVVESLSE